MNIKSLRDKYEGTAQEQLPNIKPDCEKSITQEAYKKSAMLHMGRRGTNGKEKKDRTLVGLKISANVKRNLVNKSLSGNYE